MNFSEQSPAISHSCTIVVSCGTINGSRKLHTFFAPVERKAIFTVIHPLPSSPLSPLPIPSVRLKFDKTHLCERTCWNNVPALASRRGLFLLFSGRAPRRSRTPSRTLRSRRSPEIEILSLPFELTSCLRLISNFRYPCATMRTDRANRQAFGDRTSDRCTFGKFEARENEKCGVDAPRDASRTVSLGLPSRDSAPRFPSVPYIAFTGRRSGEGMDRGFEERVGLLDWSAIWSGKTPGPNWLAFWPLSLLPRRIPDK